MTTAEACPKLVGSFRAAQHSDTMAGQSPGEILKYLVGPVRRVLIHRGEPGTSAPSPRFIDLLNLIQI